MKRSLIVGVVLAASLLLASFVVPSEASNKEIEYAQEIKTEQPQSVCFTKLPLEPARVYSYKSPKIEEDDDNTDNIEKESKEETYIAYYTEDDIVMLARLMYDECRGVQSITEQACVAWTVLNRVDASSGSVSEVITAPNQFSYCSSAPVLDDLYWLADDVLSRWNAEQNGETSVGRVLPPDYQWFVGDGEHNYFRNAYSGSYKIWDYSLPSPYES